MRSYGYILVLFTMSEFLPVKAQVVASFSLPDTICVGDTVPLINTSQNATTYYWNFCSGQMNVNPTGTNYGNPNSLFDIPTYSSLVKEGNDHFLFIVSVGASGKVIRYYLGNSFQNAPQSYDELPNSLVNNNPEDFEIVKDDIGNYYGFLANGTNNNILRYNFGNSLWNTPSVTDLGNLGTLNMPHSIVILRENSNWIGFIVNSSGNTITRFNWGNDISSIPVALNLGNVGGLVNPKAMSALQDTNFNWYLFVNNYSNNSLSRIFLGNNLLNVPVGNNLGANMNGVHGPEGLTMLKDCDGYHGFIANYQAGFSSLTRISFPNGPGGIVNSQNIGNIGNLNRPSHFSPIFRDGDNVYFYVSNRAQGLGSSSYTLLKFQNCTNSSIQSSNLQTPPPFTYNAPGIYNILLIIDEGLPTQQSVCHQVVVSSVLNMSLGPDQVICPGESVTLHPNSSFCNYLWNTGQTTPSITVSQQGIYWVSVTSGGGCSAIDSVNIDLVNAPIVDLGPDTSFCYNFNVQLDAGNGYSSYLWNTGDTTRFLAISQIGSYWVSVTNNFGCFAIDSIHINQSPIPVVLAPTLPNVCISSPPITLSGGIPINGNYYGADVIGGIFNPALAGPGTHKIFYSYTNEYGCSNLDSTQLTVYDLSVITHSSFPPFCINVPSVTLTGGNPGGGTYTGPGVINNEFHAGLTGLGTFNLTYTYSDSNNCTDSIHAGLTVYDIPVVDFSPLNPVCIGIPAFPLTGGSPAGGTYSGTGVNNGMFNPIFASTYTITYSYMDTNGCVNDSIQLLVVMNKPVVTLLPFNDICINSLPVTLSGGDPSGGTYTGPGISGTEFNPAVTGVGTFTVTYHVSNIAGCEDSAQEQIIVRPLPVVNFGYVEGICINGETIVLSSGDPPGGVYSGPGVMNGIFNPDLTGVGTFIITYTFADQYNCVDSATQTVTVYPLPNQFSVWGGGINCQNIGSPVNLDSSQVGVEYHLLLNGVNQGFPFTGNGSAFSFGNQYTSGTYTVSAIYDSTGCENMMKDSAIVNLIPLPDPALEDSLYLCEQTEILLDAGIYSDSITYLWQDGSTDRYFRVTLPGIYWVIVGLGDCFARDTVEVWNCSKLIIPNVFTPNNDAYNDKFKPKTIGDISEYRIQIFNRWGKRVYESTDVEEGWDGTVFNNGSACAEGTYYFVINYKSISYPQNSKDNNVTGAVTLLR